MSNLGVKALLIGLALGCAALTGCASQPVAAHQPSLDNVQLLRQSNIASLAVGEFKLAADAKPQVDKAVSVRGSTLSSPSKGSFASYLRDALISELSAAGKYDPASTRVISGQLIENELNAAGMSTASAAVAARFSLARDGKSVYDKRLDDKQTWESAFMGAIAIPAAINHYTEMYTRLLHRLFTDEEFRAAVTAP